MVGNYGGLLRVYSPCPSAFTPEHLLLEQRLLHPIVQLESGLLLPYVYTYMRGVYGTLSLSPHVISEVKELAVAVLHPRAIAVYRLSGSREQPLLAPVHSLPLPRTAHSMIIGTFGRATGEQCCVLSSVSIECLFLSYEQIRSWCASSPWMASCLWLTTLASLSPASYPISFSLALWCTSAELIASPLSPLGVSWRCFVTTTCVQLP